MAQAELSPMCWELYRSSIEFLISGLLKFPLPLNDMTNHRDAGELLITDKLSVLETKVTVLSSSVADGHLHS